MPLLPLLLAALSLTGTWRTDGYGQTVVVSGRSLIAYDTSSAGCLPGGSWTAAPGSTRFESPDEDAVTITPLTRDLAVEHLDSATSVRYLHRVPSLPAACTAAPATGPVATFDAFWAAYQDNYPFFAQHGVDWSASRARYRPQVSASTTPAQLQAIFSAMLAPLHDAHVALLGPSGPLFTSVRPGTEPPSPALASRLATLVTGVDLPSVGAPPRLTSYAGGRIRYATLPGGIGYLQVTGFTGYTEEDSEPANRAELLRVLSAVFTGAPRAGMIVDLRVNGGGSDALALDLAGQFTTRRHLAYAKQYLRPDGSWSVPQPAAVTPRPHAFTGPVALLVSGSTQSAGETFAQAMRERPGRIVLVGEPTQGVFSDTLDRPLPNGWTAVLPNERYLDSGGRSYDVVGLAPDVHAPFVTSGTSDVLFTRAYEWVRGS